MILGLTRDVFADTFTLGKLTVDGKDFGYTVEDKDRGLHSAMDAATIKAIKVHGATAIPVGEYKIVLYQSPRFGRVLPALVDVPGFAGVLVHPGNTAADTEGCILPGLIRTADGVAKSRQACAWLDREIGLVLAAGGTVKVAVSRGAVEPMLVG